MKSSILWLFPLQLLSHISLAAEHEGVAKHAIKLHRGKGATASQKKEWLLNNCRKLSGLLHQKNVVLNKLKNAIKAVEKDQALSPAEKLFQVHTFEIFQKELNESENSVFQAVNGLRRALQGDYKDVVNMKESSRQRLEALREAAIKVCILLFHITFTSITPRDVIPQTGTTMPNSFMDDIVTLCIG